MLAPEIPWVAHGYRGAKARKHFCNFIVDEESNRVICSDEFGPGDTGFINPRPRRIKSASVVHTSRDHAPPSTPRRPMSAMSERAPVDNKTSQRYRIRSAGTMRTPLQEGLVRTGLTFKYRNGIRAGDFERETFSPDPGHPFFHRHSRCLNHDHVHAQLQQEWPHAACVECGVNCKQNEYINPRNKPQRFRPQTAPSTRKEYDLIQKTDTLLRNIQPHFCNFVRKIEIRPRNESRPSDVPPVRQAFGGSDGEDGLDGLESASSTSSLSERRGARARPPTPQKSKPAGFTRHCSRPRTAVRPRSAGTMVKKKKSVIKTTPKVPPAKPSTGWAEKVFNLEKADQRTSKSSLAPVPPAKKKKEVTIKSVSSTSLESTGSTRRVVVKKVGKEREEPAVEEATSQPTVEMVETPATPEPPQVEESSPPVPTLDPPSRAPPSPNLLDRRASRTPRSLNQHRGSTLPDTSIHNIKESESEQNLRSAMKQTESAMNDAALKKFVQSSSHAVNHAGRLALSKQASRFELPMDMLSLRTLTPQEYLRKYCVVSSRRQSLYHKMFIKNKEPKKSTLHVKELVKSLKDVLTDTLDDNMVTTVLDMTDINEETEVDLKLFSGLAALSERMLYAKFVTEDTEGMADHQKERIECADFFALDWKFHGVSVNAPMERLLRSL